MPHRLPIVLTGLALTAGLTGAPQIAAQASHSQQVRVAPAALSPSAKVGEQATAQLAVRYERSVTTLARPKKIARVMRPLAFYRKTARFNDHSRIHPNGHAGLDMAAPRGTSVRAAMSGRVTFAGWDGNYGRKVVISHGKGLVTVYGHLNRIKVKVGQRVTTGMRIGTVGTSGRTTGPHLHFEVRKNGVPRNPTTYMRTLGIRL